MVAQARMVVRKLRNTNNREIPVSEDFKRAVFFICFTPTVQGTEEQRQKRHGTWFDLLHTLSQLKLFDK